MNSKLCFPMRTYLATAGVFSLRTLLASAILISFGTALPAKAETVFDVIREAGTRNPNVQAAFKLLEAADLDRKEVLAGYMPEIGVNSSFGTEQRDRESGTTKLNGAQLEVKLTQSLFDGGRIRYKANAAEALRTLAKFEISTRQIRVSLDAAGVYLDVLRTTEQAHLANTYLTKIEALAAQMNDRAAIDSGLRSDQMLAEKQLVDARVQAIMAREARKLAVKLFVEVVGREPGKLQPVALKGLGLPASADAAMETALKTHPSLKAAAAQIEEKKNRMRADQSELAPNVDFEVKGKLGHNLDGVEGKSNDLYAGVKLSFKFGTGGGAFYKQEASRLRMAAAVDDETSTMLEIRRQVLSAWSGYEVSRSLLPEAGKRVKLAAGKLEDFKREFEAGSKELLECFFIQAELFSVKQAEVDARYSQLTSAFGLLAASGSLGQ